MTKTTSVRRAAGRRPRASRAVVVTSIAAPVILVAGVVGLGAECVNCARSDLCAGVRKRTSLPRYT